MARKLVARTPERGRPGGNWRERIAPATDAAIAAGIAAIESGADMDAAMRAAIRGVTSPADYRFCYPDEPGPSLDQATAGRPRLAAPGWDADRQRAFLVSLAETGCVRHTCAAVGLSRQSAYALRRREPHSVFAIAWDTAIQMARQTLLDEATERALTGRGEPVRFRGEHVGTRTVHSDRLLMFLPAHRPEPAHPVLNPREQMQLWPAMLEGVDRVLPPPLDAARLAELQADATDGGQGAA